MKVERVCIEITGKEYRRRLVPVKVTVRWIVRSLCEVSHKKIKKIWDKRRCFICHGKFNHGEMATILGTDKGNKIICEKCTKNLKV